jgi:hypothetical protein
MYVQYVCALSIPSWGHLTISKVHNFEGSQFRRFVVPNRLFHMNFDANARIS